MADPRPPHDPSASSPSAGKPKAWGGVFEQATDARVEAFSESVSFDKRLADDDIDGSIAHSAMLAACGIISAAEAEAIRAGLEEIRTEIHAGTFAYTISKEDIHLHVESALTARLGDTGRRLHTARSRNDQVATDLRLFCRRAIDREHVRASLEFAAVAANSLDAASDRDFACELAFVIALAGVHLSQWAEEWIIWSTEEFGFLKLPENFCTGSSIMPQKINPDVLELVRGKSARTIGNLQSLLVLLKGLPTAYNRDLQEDKEPLFDSVDTLEAILGVAAPLVAGTSFDRARIAATLDRGHLDATSLMEALIASGTPQRTAHETVGKLVRRAMRKGVSLEELADDEFSADCAGWNGTLRSALGASRAVGRMASFGSTAPARVTEQIKAWQQRLGGESGA